MDRLEDRSLPSVTVGVNYAGINSNNSSCGCEPPDTIAAAGPTNVIEMVNLAMQINTKSGSLVSTTSLSSFFSSLSPASQSDPFVVFDENISNSTGPNGRFIVGVLDFTSTSSPDFLDFAVSNDSDATHGFSAVHKFNVGEGSFFADYPRVGLNADAFFADFNMFNSAGSYDHPQIMAIQISSIISGSSSTFTSFHHDANSGLFTLAPALMHGATAGGPEYFVTESVNANQIDVIKETNVLSNTPTDTDNNIGVASYVQPPAVPQPGGGSMTPNDSRVLNAAWRNNILVAAQTVGTGSPTEAHARWYQFNTSSTPSLTQSGEINPGSGVGTFFPSIDIDANNNLGMTYMEASSSEFTSMYVIGRTPSDATGTMETAVKVAAGTVAYSGTRAGDFSGTSVDPSTGTSFWSANEYVPSGPQWSTWVASFSVAGAVDHLSVSAPGAATAGSAFTITVTALTPSNATDPNYRGTVTFSSSDTSAGLPANYTFTATDAGSHTFTNLVTLKRAGNQTVTATDTAGSGGATPGSATISVSPGAASQLAFGQQPTNTVANSTISPAPTVRVLDAFGNLESADNSDQVTVAIGTNPGSGTLSGTLTVTVSGGVATFGGLSINNPGNGYTLAASSGSLTGATSNAFNITPDVATHYSISGPSSATAGTVFSITVSALDAANKVVTSYAGTITFSSSDGQASFPGNYTFTGSDAGVHTFTNLTTLKTAGSQTVTGKDTVTSSITGSLTVSVSPAAASKLAFGQQPTNTVANATITPAPTVRVLDAFNNLETGDNSDQITVAIGTNPAGGTLSGTLTVTVSSGVATFGNLSINNVGNGYTLTAGSGSLTGATSNAFNITATAPTHFSVTGPSSSTAGSALTITVTALDAGNHVVASYTGTVHFTSSDAQAGLPANYTFTGGDAGAHTFTNLTTLKTAGNQSVTATDTVTSSISGSVTVSVSPGAASVLVFGQQPTNTVAGSSITPAPTVKVQDAFGNLETSDNTDQVTMAIGTNPASGTLSGTLTVTASGGVATFSNLSINNAGTGYTLLAGSGALTSATSNAFNITAASSGVSPVTTYQANRVITGNTAVGNSGFANVPGLTFTLTTGADNVRISGSLGAYNKNPNAYNSLYVRILVDGVVKGGPYGFHLSEATSTFYVETFNFENDISVAAGSHTIVVQATSSSRVNVVWDPGTNQTLRITDYHTFTSVGSAVAVVQSSANEGTPPTFGGSGTTVASGTFTNVPSLSGAITTTATDTLRLEGTLSLDNNTLSMGIVEVRFLIDSTATAAQTFLVTPDAGPDTFRTIDFEMDVPNVAAGAHTIVIQAMTVSGSGTLYFDGGSASVPGGGGTAGYSQTLRITDYRTLAGSTPSGSSGWVSTADVSASASGALASTYTNVPGLTSTFTLNGTDTVRLEGSLNIFNSSSAAFGFPAVRFVIDGVTLTVGNSWNVSMVDSTGLNVEEELVFEDFITLAAGTHTVTLQAESTSGSVSFENSTGSSQTMHVAAFQLVSGITVHGGKHHNPEQASYLAMLYRTIGGGDGSSSNAVPLQPGHHHHHHNGDVMGAVFARLDNRNAQGDVRVDALFASRDDQNASFRGRTHDTVGDLAAFLLSESTSKKSWEIWGL